MYKTSDEPIDITITRIQEHADMLVALLRSRSFVYNVVSYLDHIYIYICIHIYIYMYTYILLDIGNVTTCAN